MQKQAIKPGFRATGNPAVDAIFLVMTISASVHMAILIVYAFLTHDFGKLQYFSILNLDLLFPNLEHWSRNILLSVAMYSGLYLLAWGLCRRFLRREKEISAL